MNLLDRTLIGDIGRFVGTLGGDPALPHVDFKFMEHPEEFGALAELVPGDGTFELDLENVIEHA